MRKSQPQAGSSGNQASNPNSLSEQLFCIMNEKLIFQTLKESTNYFADDSVNAPYFIYEALQIFNILLDTMQKSQQFESESEYLDYIKPFID